MSQRLRGGWKRNLTKVGKDKALIYTVCTLIAAMIVGFGVSILTGILIWPLLMLTGGVPR